MNSMFTRADTFSDKSNFISSHTMVQAALESGLRAELLYLVLAAAAAVTYFLFSCRPKLHSGFPTAGLGASGVFGSFAEAQKLWLEHGPSIIQKGLKQVESLAREPSCLR